MKVSMNKDWMIHTQGLTKQFKTVTAVDNLDIAIAPGEVFGFLGPNGAGKTTTIRMLTALIAPTSGTAQVAGFSLGEADIEIRRRVGILTESPGMYNNLSAERNLSFFGDLYEIENVPARVEKYLRILGLWDRRNDPVATFSKGMRQKLAIARALLHEPEILFLDEPTSGLDPEASRLVRDFISNLKAEGRTIVLCTHNLTEADHLCDRIAVFRSRLLVVDTPQNLRRQIYGRMVVFHLAAVEEQFVKALQTFDFVHETRIVDNKILVSLSDPATQNPILVNQLVTLGAEIQFVSEMKRSLEDVYLQLINQQDQTAQPIEGEKE